jgi:hypothetical protein
MTSTVLVFLIISLLIYFVPTLVAIGRKNFGAIFVTNLLFGWTMIGWGIALIWAVKDPSAS